MTERDHGSPTRQYVVTQLVRMATAVRTSSLFISSTSHLPTSWSVSLDLILIFGIMVLGRSEGSNRTTLAVWRVLVMPPRSGNPPS